MESFVAVVDASSFSAAARRLELPVSTVSRQVARLEERLGVRLLHRTTRRVTTTDIGQAYYERCRQIVADTRAAEESVRQAHGAPRGLLRISAPPTNLRATAMEQMIAEFLLAHPGIEVEIDTESRYVDLVAEGYDVALRGGALKDSTLTARRLQLVRSGTVAAPAYLARRGRPRKVADLDRHECIAVRAPGRRARWPLMSGGSIAVRGRLVTNDLAVARTAAVAGLGIAHVPFSLVAEDLAAGELEHVLAAAIGRPTDGLHVVYPGGRQVPAKVRVFVDHAVAFFGRAPQ
ncbi:MAG TPA: LysR family transcriptional regulator [Kofleriaceae bacterium]|nr:LysR family transcriptional regulator [Kofleriaceae bacterium]